jgi:hypothetical protein
VDVGRRRYLPENPLLQAVIFVFITKKEDPPRRCFRCVGKALSLTPNDLHVENLVHGFSSSSNVTRYFRRKNLENK